MPINKANYELTYVKNMLINSENNVKLHKNQYFFDE